MQSRWDKPNTPPDTAAADLSECRQSAQQEATRQSARYGAYSSYPISRYGSPYEDVRWRAEYQQWSVNERLYLQNRFADYCMHGKGYERVPVEPS